VKILSSLILLLLAISELAAETEADDYKKATPTFPDIEVCIVNRSTSVEMMIGRPNSRINWNTMPDFFVGPMTNKDPVMPETSIRYIGTNGKKDLYEIVFNSLGKSPSPAVRISYEGANITLHKDTGYLVGMRPSTQPYLFKNGKWTIE
jgi:hypothetical protein